MVGIVVTLLICESDVLLRTESLFMLAVSQGNGQPTGPICAKRHTPWRAYRRFFRLHHPYDVCENGEFIIGTLLIPKISCEI